jgi:nucleotide-binding universal stress UspA family protein
MTPPPVLAAFDPVARDAAPVRFAAAVAGYTGAPLIVASVVANDELVDRLAAGQLAEEPLADRTDALEMAVRELGDAGVTADALELGATSAPHGLSLAAESIGAALVVVGSTARARPQRVEAGSTAQRLLNGAPCAVAVVPVGWSGPAVPDTVGVGFVDTADGRDALHGAHALADRSGARLRVLCAVQPRAWMLRSATFETVAEELRTDIETAAQSTAGTLLGAPVDVDVDVAEPDDVLVGASAEVDVLVSGSRGYGPRPAALLGGVTRRLATAAACPVVVVAHGAEIRLDALVADEA